MNAPAMSRDEFVSLLETTEHCIEQRRRAEYARVRKCAQLSRAIAAIVDRFPRKPYRQIAAELGVDQGAHLLWLIDQLEAESQVNEPVPQVLSDCK